jgi:hypothetical protein
MITHEQYTQGIEDIKCLAKEGNRQEIEKVMLKLWESFYVDGVRLDNIARSFGMKES